MNKKLKYIIILLFITFNIKTNAYLVSFSKNEGQNTETNIPIDSSDDIDLANALTLTDLIYLGLARNNELKLTYLNIDLNNLQLKIVKSSRFPSLDLSLNYGKSNNIAPKNNILEIDNKKEYTFSKNIKDVFSPLLKINEYDFTAGLQFNYVLFKFGVYEDAIKQQLSKVNISKFENNSKIQTTILKIGEDYYTILLNQAKKQAAIENEKRTAEIYKFTSLKHNIGLATLVDKTSAEAANIRDKAELIKIDNDISISNAALNKLLNLPPDIMLFIKNDDNINNNFEIKKIKKDFKVYLDLALKNRDDLKILYEQKKQYEKALTIAYKENLPQLDLYATLNNSIDGSKKNNSTTAASIQLSTKINLFSGFKDINTIKRSKKEIQAVNLQIEEKNNIIKNDIYTIYNQLLTIEQMYESSIKSLKNYKEIINLKFGMYQNGKTTMLDVLEASSKLAAAKIEYLDNKYKWFIVRLQFLQIIGLLTIDNMNNINSVNNIEAIE